MSRDLSPSDPRLSKVAAASLTDAMGRHFPHRCHVEGLISPTPDRRLFGRAATIRYLPVRADLVAPEKHNLAGLFYQAIGAEAAGKVLVLSASGHSRVSVAGGTKLSRLENHKLAGLITDGRVRDFSEIQGYSFSAWCAGETIRAAGDTLMPYEANVPVALKGVTIVPGDYIYADRSGAVIIPGAHVEVILDEVIGIEKQDRRSIDIIRNENREEILNKRSDEK